MKRNSVETVTPGSFKELYGIGVSPGIVIGKAVVIKRQTCRAGRYYLPPEFIEKEVHRFRDAVSRAKKDLVTLREYFAEDLAEGSAVFKGKPIFGDFIPEFGPFLLFRFLSFMAFIHKNEIPSFKSLDRHSKASTLFLLNEFCHLDYKDWIFSD